MLDPHTGGALGFRGFGVSGSEFWGLGFGARGFGITSLGLRVCQQTAKGGSRRPQTFGTGPFSRGWGLGFRG